MMMTLNANRKYIVFLTCLALLLTFGSAAFSQKAYATEGHSLKTAQTSLTAQASYPDFTITSPAWIDGLKLGQKKLSFKASFSSGYKQNKYLIEIQNSNGDVVASFDEHHLNYYEFKYMDDVVVGDKLTLTVDARNYEPGMYFFKAYAYYYSFGQWCESPYNPISGGYPFHVNGITQTKFSVDAGSSFTIPAYSPKDYAFKFKKASGNKKIRVTKKGVVKVNKNLPGGTYKVRVKAFIGNDRVATKTLKIKVTHR